MHNELFQDFAHTNYLLELIFCGGNFVNLYASGQKGGIHVEIFAEP